MIQLQISIWIKLWHVVLIYCPKRTNRSLVSAALCFWWLLGFTGWPFHISWKNSPEGEKWESLVSRFGAFCKLCAIAHIVLQNLEFLCFSLFALFPPGRFLNTQNIHCEKCAPHCVWNFFSKDFGISWWYVPGPLCKDSACVLLFLIKIFTTSTLIWTRVVTEQHLLRRQGHNLFWGLGAEWVGVGGAGGPDMARIWIAWYRLKTSTAGPMCARLGWPRFHDSYTLVSVLIWQCYRVWVVLEEVTYRCYLQALSISP